MPTIATTARLLTKQALLPVLAALLPKLSLAGKIVGGAALVSPTLTHLINRWKGYDPSADLDLSPEEQQDRPLNAITPRLVRPHLEEIQEKFGSVNPLLAAAHGLWEFRARRR